MKIKLLGMKEIEIEDNELYYEDLIKIATALLKVAEEIK